MYRQKGYNGVIYEPYRHAFPAPITFLHELPNLRAVWLPAAAEILDDTVVFDLPDITVLLLENRSKSELDFGRLRRTLRVVETFWRPGIDTLRDASLLKSVTIDRYCGGDFSVVANLSNLESVRVDVPSRHTLSLSNYGCLPALRRLRLEGGQLAADSKIPSSLTQIELIDVHNPDLASLGGCTSLEIIEIQNCGSVPTLRPLHRCPRLHTLLLDKTEIGDGDTTLFRRLRPDT